MVGEPKHALASGARLKQTWTEKDEQDTSRVEQDRPREGLLELLVAHEAQVVVLLAGGAR